MRTARLIAVVLALVPAVAGAVPTIPDVATLADLRRLPAVPTDTGFDVRVGWPTPGRRPGR